MRLHKIILYNYFNLLISSVYQQQPIETFTGSHLLNKFLLQVQNSTWWLVVSHEECWEQKGGEKIKKYSTLNPSPLWIAINSVIRNPAVVLSVLCGAGLCGNLQTERVCAPGVGDAGVCLFVTDETEEMCWGESCGLLLYQFWTLWPHEDHMLNTFLVTIIRVQKWTQNDRKNWLASRQATSFDTQKSKNSKNRNNIKINYSES